VLVVSRKENESIRIEPIEGVDPSLTLQEVFANGAIVVRLTHIGMRRVRLVIEAPTALKIMRSAPASVGGSDTASTDAQMPADLTERPSIE
jgi:sRNA-binding carbon storage regulator CsrA